MCFEELHSLLVHEMRIRAVPDQVPAALYFQKLRLRD